MNDDAGFSVLDLFSEVRYGILSRVGRSLLILIGAMVGVGVLTTSVGLTSSAQSNISEHFAALYPRELTIADTKPSETTPAFPINSEMIIDRLPGVVSSSVIWQTPVFAINSPGNLVERNHVTVPVLAASPSIFLTVDSFLRTGRYFDRSDARNRLRVVVLGQNAADSLGLTVIDGVNSVLIDGIPFVVLGVIKNVKYESSMLDSAVIPSSTAVQFWGQSTSGSQMDVIVDAGTAQVVSSEVPFALSPSEPSRLSVVTNSLPIILQGQVEGDLGGLLTFIALIALTIGLVAIGSISLTSVMERIPEIGLRRALGARKRHIAMQFLCENLVLGTLGGMCGTWLALIAEVELSRSRHWVPVMSPLLMLLAPMVGTIEGGIAGLYPALRAARLNPADALRR